MTKRRTAVLVTRAISQCIAGFICMAAGWRLIHQGHWALGILLLAVGVGVMTVR